MWNTIVEEAPTRLVVTLPAGTGYLRFRAQRVLASFRNDPRFRVTAPDIDALTWRFVIETAQPPDVPAARAILGRFRIT